ncbi:hypothetical protein BN946_scf184976.g38 [Trametes cinnabarina]|uniref:Pirin C-terminal domain-containing protein n=1 Tax=Pycnoporus cinnabarinus TaxID=5643 RepID=A0A060SAN5_PYCCI|nr:hypothetical protein BN946_scf184976.g38 [Trametes cinnabarina]
MSCYLGFFGPFGTFGFFGLPFGFSVREFPELPGVVSFSFSIWDFPELPGVVSLAFLRACQASGLSLFVLLLTYQTPLLSHKSFFSTSLSRNMAAAQKSRSVVKKVYAVETPEGEGVLVRRSIGSMSLRKLSPFLMLNHFHISKEDEPEPNGLQLWINLPKQYKMMEPNYQELDPKLIPTAYPEGKDGPTQIKVISWKSYGVESPVKPYGGCWYFHVNMSKKGSSIFQEISVDWTVFIYLFKGTATVGDETTPNEKYYTLVLDSGKDGETGISITSAEDGMEFVIVASEPLNQPVVQYGPFVMTSA